MPSRLNAMAFFVGREKNFNGGKKSFLRAFN
jgi:hypothetical protein